METATLSSPQSYPVASSPLPLSPEPSGGMLPMAGLAPGAEPLTEAVPAAKAAPDGAAALEISAAPPSEGDAADGEGASGPGGLPPPSPSSSPPKPLKTALSRAPNPGGDGGSRLAASKRTVSWADLTSTGTLTQVKEYQPESAPGSPLSDASWEADHGHKGCCALM